MFSYSHEKDGGWLGEYPRASEALIAGRAIYGDDTTIYVSGWHQAHYSDLFIGAQTLLSYMREDGTEKMNDDDLAAFDSLSPESIDQLSAAIKDLIGEWEIELPQDQQFTGVWVDIVRPYRQGEEVRPGHFPNG